MQCAVPYWIILVVKMHSLDFNIYIKRSTTNKIWKKNPDNLRYFRIFDCRLGRHLSFRKMPNYASRASWRSWFCMTFAVRINSKQLGGIIKGYLVRAFHILYTMGVVSVMLDITCTLFKMQYLLTNCTESFDLAICFMKFPWIMNNEKNNAYPDASLKPFFRLIAFSQTGINWDHDFYKISQK